MARVFDLAMTHGLDSDDFFVHRVQERCAQKAMNFFLIEPLWVESFLAFFESGALSVRVLLNMHSEHHNPNEPFHRLVKTAANRGVLMIDDPGVALAAFDKARFHSRLLDAGMPVPTTLIVGRAEVEAFAFGPALFEKLGSTFVIKPSTGYGRRGVVMDACRREDLLRSMKEWPGSHYLLQRKILPRQHQGRPVYFRAFFVFGKIWVCQWNCFTDAYQKGLLSEDPELGAYHERIVALVSRLAGLCGMHFFSTEIAVDERDELCLIDYVNDQCHMLTQSSSPRNGVPDELVSSIAISLVDGAWSMIHPESSVSPVHSPEP